MHTQAAQPPMSERLLLTQLAQHVGLQLLMNTHTELEREGQLIVEQVGTAAHEHANLAIAARLRFWDGSVGDSQHAQQSCMDFLTGHAQQHVATIFAGSCTATCCSGKLQIRAQFHA
eukprot:84985-Pelagomonas_calceolata.AAC.4